MIWSPPHTALDLYNSKLSSFVVPGANQFEIAVSCNNSFKYFVEVLLIALRYQLTFLLKENDAFTVLVILKGLLFSTFVQELLIKKN